MMRRAEHLFRRPMFHHLAAMHDGDAIGDMPDHGDIVRDEQVGCAEARLQLDQLIQDRCLHRDIQCRGWLIAYHQPRGGGKGTCDADALLFSAREFTRKPSAMAVA